MKISVVIPTYNRPFHLNRVLQSLKDQTFQPSEVIIVDASPNPVEIQNSFEFPLIIIASLPSVCKQRNLGIRQAVFDWILLCDDDLEFPADYLMKLIKHIQSHSEAGAVSGKFLQQHNGNWVAQYPIHSTLRLLYRFLFLQGFWGEIVLEKLNIFSSYLVNFYKRKGNHIALSGWPVLTDFSGEYFKTRIYTLGAALVKKEWLLTSPYDEILDANGIGDNYGVALGFPPEGIHVVTNAFVLHHLADENRLTSIESYYKRVMAIAYFIKTRLELKRFSRIYLLWSLIGNFGLFFFKRRWGLLRVNIKLIVMIGIDLNHYLLKK
jgi:glycosyltransferase involved in cell wall biosynthesis